MEDDTEEKNVNGFVVHKSESETVNLIWHGTPDETDGVGDDILAKMKNSLSNSSMNYEVESKEERVSGSSRSMSPEKDPYRSGRGSPSPEKESTKTGLIPFLKSAGLRKRNASGKSVSKFENVPELDQPISAESYETLGSYFNANDFTTTEISKCISKLLTVNDCIPETGRTALHLACDNGDTAMVEALLENLHDPGIQDSSGNSPIHLAIHRHHSIIVKKLLKHDPQLINSKNNISTGFFPIHTAILVGDIESVKIMINRKCDLTLLTRNGQSVLHLAVGIYSKILQEELEKEDEENRQQRYHRSISMMERMKKEESTFQMLDLLFSKLESSALIECLHANPENSHETLLHHFTYINYIRGVKACLDYTSETNSGIRIVDKNGVSPLLVAVDKSNYGIAKEMLLNSGSPDVNATHPLRKNKTCLQIMLNLIHYQSRSSTSEECELIELLLKHGANVEFTKDEESGDAPIFIVSRQNFDNAITFLFLDHLNENTINAQELDTKDSILHYAVSLRTDPETIVKIMQKGANVMLKNEVYDIEKSSASSSLEDLILTVPTDRPTGILRNKTALEVSFSMRATDIYFKAMLMCGVSRVFVNVDEEHMLEFLQTHMVAAASRSHHQILRELVKLINISLLETVPHLCDLTNAQLLEKVVHYFDTNHGEAIFHRTPLSWANENDDPISASELLHLEYQIHGELQSGLRCMKNQLTNDKLLYWITRTYNRFFKKKSSTRWSMAFMMVTLELGMAYFFYIFDIYSDYQLTTEYSKASDNITQYLIALDQCANDGLIDKMGYNQTCNLDDHQNPKSTYIVAYYMTWISMLISLGAYLSGIVMFYDTRKQKCDGILSCTKTCIEATFIKLCWPVFHFYRRVSYEKSENKAHHRKKLLEFESIWHLVRTIEYGVEATIQLVIIVYLLIPTYKAINIWNFQETVRKCFNGIAHFLSAGRYKACLVEKVFGKLIMSLCSQSISITILKFQKHGLGICEHLTNLLPFYVSNLLQILARIFALRILFLSSEDVYPHVNTSTAAIIFFIIHFLLVFVIKFTFEVQPAKWFKNNPTWMSILNIFKFIVGWFSSCIIYIRVKPTTTCKFRHSDQGNTFLPQALFQLLILCEHVVIIIPPLYTHLETCVPKENFSLFAWVIPLLWFFSVVLQFMHYNYNHIWSQTNGPSQTYITAQKIFDDSTDDPNEMLEDDLESRLDENNEWEGRRSCISKLWWRMRKRKCFCQLPVNIDCHGDISCISKLCCKSRMQRVSCRLCKMSCIDAESHYSSVNQLTDEAETISLKQTSTAESSLTVDQFDTSNSQLIEMKTKPSNGL